METLAKIFITPSRQNQFIQENIFKKASVRQTALAMNTNSGFTGSCYENSFWYHQIDLREIRTLRGGQPIFNFDAARNCGICVAKIKAMNFQDDILSIPIDNFKHHYELLFDLTSMKDATDNCHHIELVAEPLKLQLNFTFPQEYVIELFVLGERMFLVAVDKFAVVGKKIQNGICFSPANNQLYSTTQVSVP